MLTPRRRARSLIFVVQSGLPSTLPQGACPCNGADDTTLRLRGLWLLRDYRLGPLHLGQFDIRSAPRGHRVRAHKRSRAPQQKSHHSITVGTREQHGRRYRTTSTILRSTSVSRPSAWRSIGTRRRFMMLPTLPNDARDGESYIRVCLDVSGYGQKPNVGAKSHGQKACTQTASLEQRS
jgi:hypothetical protein